MLPSLLASITISTSLDGLSLRPRHGRSLQRSGPSALSDFEVGWTPRPSETEDSGSTDQLQPSPEPWQPDGGDERLANGGFEDPPACAVLEPGLTRWLCGVVGQIRHFGLRISPADDESSVLTVRTEGLMVSGLVVQDVHSASRHSGNMTTPSGFSAAVEGIGFRVHVDSFEVSSANCSSMDSWIALLCRSEPAVALPEGALHFTVTRADFEKVHHLSLAPEVGAHLKADAAEISLVVQAEEGAAYPPPLRVPRLGLELPPYGLSLSVWRDLALGLLHTTVAAVQARARPTGSDSS